jgi:hypothetical protein
MRQLTLQEVQHANELLAKIKVIDEKAAQLQKVAESIANEVTDIKISFEVVHLEAEPQPAANEKKFQRSSFSQMLHERIMSDMGNIYGVPSFIGLCNNEPAANEKKSLLDQTVSNKAALMVLSILVQDLNSRRANYILQLIDYNIDVEQFITNDTNRTH